MRLTRVAWVVGLAAAPLGLSGCAEDPSITWSVQALTAGDAWTYRITLAADGTRIAEDVQVLPPVDLPWGDGVLPAYRRVTGTDHGAPPFVEFVADGATVLGQVRDVVRQDRSSDQEDLRNEDWWERPCAAMPVSLTPAHEERVTCRGRSQTAAASGETQMLIIETLTTTFTVGALERIETPAGAFEAVRIDVAYLSDSAGEAVVLRNQPTLW